MVLSKQLQEGRAQRAAQQAQQAQQAGEGAAGPLEASACARGGEGAGATAAAADRTLQTVAELLDARVESGSGFDTLVAAPALTS
jgi:hypothetical protein